MRKFALTLLSLTLGPTALADSGRTADGCTYSVINGRYVTNCATSGTEAVPTPAAPVTSYDSVPLRQNPAAPQPSVQMLPPAPPATMNIAIAPPSQAHAPMTYRERRDEQRDQFIDATYVGALLGSATISDPGAGSATGLGVVLGTSLDDFLGIEFGYSFTKMDTRLDLPSRAGTSSAQNPANSTDSSLASHLVTAEFQAHLTDALKRLRPYAGLGLGWKSSTLQEELPPTYYAQNANASLSQTALGPVASAGTKFRLTPTFQLGFSFRYFLPLSRQTARLSADGDTRLRLSDAKLTGSAQHQVSGGLLYSF